MRLLHLLWPHLPLRLVRARASGSFPAGPVVLGGQPWTAGSVLDVDQLARELGVRRRMPLGIAHRLAPEATFLDPDPAADETAVEAALAQLAVFSPGVAGATDVADVTFGRLEVQLDGLERLWGAEPILVARIGEALAPLLPGLPRAGIAGTRFAATVAASRSAPTGAPPWVPAGHEAAARVPLLAVPPDGEAAFLAPLPAASLTPDPDVRARLARFGLRRIGQVAALPRSALVARFGAEGERLHDRATGRETDPFRPRRDPERLVLALPIEPPIGDLEPLRFVLRRLVDALTDQLLARGSAAGKARLALTLDPTFALAGTPSALVVEQRLPEPTAEAAAVERLLLARLERTPPPAPVTRLELLLADVLPAAGQQLTLFTPQAGRAARLVWQLARLALRFGEDRVGWVELVDPEAALPERRWRWRPVAVDGERGEGRDERGGASR